MRIFQTSLNIVLFSIILFNFTCSSTNSSSDKEEVNSIQTANQNWGINAPELRKTPIPFDNSHIIRTKIENKITVEEIYQGRDLSQYDKEVTSDCQTYKCIEKKMRNFIWEHWKNKKRGYITNQLKGIDVSFTDHIFIESMENGDWRILWRVERYQYSDIVEGYIDDYVNIISVKKDGQKLVLKNDVGEVVKTL